MTSQAAGERGRERRFGEDAEAREREGGTPAGSGTEQGGTV